MTTAAEEFRNWLDGASAIRIRNCGHRFIEINGCDECRRFLDEWRLPKTLDERIAEKEKRIKRKIQARIRAQKKRAQKLSDAEMSIEEVSACIEKRLNL